MQKVIPLILEYLDYVFVRPEEFTSLALCEMETREFWSFPKNIEQIEVVFSDEYMPRSYKVRQHPRRFNTLQVYYEGAWNYIATYSQALRVVNDMLDATGASELYVKIRY